ncbi:unnamed protein product [Mytilus edulis]|uniref:Uncharacterized protein n=1 Tax=Mytilus edulis TaxID=6550 RepID=A0A8S3T6F8_MYTED|nr:unnamed protein product [Mytilus edulis]
MAPTKLSNCLHLLAKLNATLQSNTTTDPFNLTRTTPKVVEESEIEALLYIVVTLLFYSLGIIIGIVSYLKREKREIEQDRIYDQYITSREDQVWSSKYAKVQQVVSRLQVLENEKLTRLAAERDTEKLLHGEQIPEEKCENENLESEKAKTKRSIHLKPHFSKKMRITNERSNKKDIVTDNSGLNRSARSSRDNIC